MALLLIFIVLHTTYGQKKLAQNSFFNLSFGATPQEVAGKLELDLTISYGLKYYKYKDKRLKVLYGQKVHEINLGFRDDQLEYIDIYFAKFEAADFQTLTDSLIKDFGQPLSFEAVEKGVIESVRWKDDNTTLDFYRYGSNAVDMDDRNKSVIAIFRPLY